MKDMFDGEAEKRRRTRTRGTRNEPERRYPRPAVCERRLPAPSHADASARTKNTERTQRDGNTPRFPRIARYRGENPAVAGECGLYNFILDDVKLFLFFCETPQGIHGERGGMRFRTSRPARREERRPKRYMVLS
jgi:hypothetical protein